MKNINWLIIVTIIVSLMPTMVFGEAHEQFYKEYYSQNFSGWKGIVFICSYDTKDKVLEKICQRAITDIELLSASNKINLKVIEANNTYKASFKAEINKFVILSYSLLATEGQNKAVHARLAFTTFYSNAVEKGAKLNSLDSMPRSGDLELWSRSAIGSGSADGIINPFSDNAEMLIKQALTLFIKYSK